MKKTFFALVGALLLLTACNTNTPAAISVRGKIYKHPTAVQYLKFKTDSVLYSGDFGNEALSNHTFAYTQKDEVVTVYTPTPEHLLAYEGFIQRGDIIYELFADASDPNYQDHQPQDPRAFSLVGKRYIYAYPDAEGGDTLEFYTDSTGSRHDMPYYDEHFDYLLDYPTITTYFGEDKGFWTMSDTAHIYVQANSRVYILNVP